MPIPTNHISRVALAAAIRSALGGRVFNITGVRQAVEVLGLPYSNAGQDWANLGALHCNVAMAELDPKALRELVETCARVMGLEAYDLVHENLIPMGTAVDAGMLTAIPAEV